MPHNSSDNFKPRQCDLVEISARQSESLEKILSMQIFCRLFHWFRALSTNNVDFIYN